MMNRVKKMVLIMLSAILFASIPLALAFRTNPPASEAGQYLPESGYRKVAADYRKISVKYATIKQNNAEIRAMKVAMKVRIKEIEARIIQLKQQNGKGLTAGDVAEMKTVTVNVEKAKSVLQASSGHLNRKVSQLKEVKKSGDSAGILRSLEEIISIQNSRINTLKEINKNLDDMKKTLG
ncbi:hypothetical protein DCCM_2912 [Desulfocucumis palustris]|uniref:Uncharacterized protein n=1 Tax=Desulfocucumis palustris TaxID=1898651 RepID=A0A2L2XIR1_9FIRM|nr:hypothetical protein [Desulfocucumis palustris]GBF33801.1 hypothetical protein DCCM_2912 [Desulfocucumis palustris]